MQSPYETRFAFSRFEVAAQKQQEPWLKQLASSLDASSTERE